MKCASLQSHQETLWKMFFGQYFLSMRHAVTIPLLVENIAETVLRTISKCQQKIFFGNLKKEVSFSFFLISELQVFVKGIKKISRQLYEYVRGSRRALWIWFSKKSRPHSKPLRLYVSKSEKNWYSEVNEDQNAVGMFWKC